VIRVLQPTTLETGLGAVGVPTWTFMKLLEVAENKNSIGGGEYVNEV
jgi:hypothetical protein